MKTRRLDQLADLGATFGDHSVTPGKRRDAVIWLFDRISPRYDLMNDLMSFGLHRLWKRAMTRAIRVFLTGKDGPVLDLAGGTGDVALAIASALPAREIVVADASAGMLAVARRRGGDAIDLVQAEGENLPFPDDCLAAISLAFGLRNMTDPVRALCECRRVLRPGGRLFLLEFSRADAWFSPLYALHSRFIIPALGALVARDRGAYRYLVESIRLFPERDDISRELRKAGLEPVSVASFMFGVAVHHIGQKP